MIGPSYHLFHLSNYHMFIKGINWLLSAIPSSNNQREIMHVIQRFDGWLIRIAIHSDCKTWLQFGQTEGSITKENIAYALMGSYEHLWGTCDLIDYNFDSRNTKYSFRPTHVWYEVVIGRNVTYIVCSFPLTIIWVLNTCRLYDADDSLFLNRVCGNIKYDIRRECKCGFLVMYCFR